MKELLEKLEKIMTYYYQLKSTENPNERLLGFMSMNPDTLEMCQLIDEFANDNSINLK